MLTQRSRLPQRQRRTFGAPGVRRLGRDFNLNLAVSGHASRAPQCLLMAQSGHPNAVDECPLSGVKRTSITARHQRRAPVTVASSAFISCCGSAARITPPITAMPAEPSASTSAAHVTLRPPIARMGTCAAAAISASPLRPISDHSQVCSQSRTPVPRSHNRERQDRSPRLR